MQVCLLYSYAHSFLVLFPSPSSQCTVTCGQGYQMRAVKCVVGNYMSVVDDNECNAATKPMDTQVGLLICQTYNNLWFKDVMDTHLLRKLILHCKERDSADCDFQFYQSVLVEGQHTAICQTSIGKGWMKYTV